jgi:glutamyl-Q tRNA(Asp) synthetase
MEDVDTPRVVPGAADDILRTLEACGMAWDGSVVHQSTRSEAYDAALHELRRQGQLYACGCSRREIADSAVAGIEGFVYPGTCRGGLAPGRTARAWRVRTQGAVIGFEDAIQGRVGHDVENDVGDFVLYRADRIYAYQLAVVVDDAEHGITHVTRGADLLDSTPRQIHLQHLLGLHMPVYAHLPIAVNAQGQKLSKQTLAKPVERADIASSLVLALRFLGQQPPVELRGDNLNVIWQWAMQNWRLPHVPRVRTQVFVEGAE